jgi:hypothetical protein
MVQKRQLGSPMPDQLGWFSGFRAPLRTRQITIHAASRLSGPSLWYYSIRASGHTLWLSLKEHASAGTRNPYLEAAARG